MKLKIPVGGRVPNVTYLPTYLNKRLVNIFEFKKNCSKIISTNICRIQT